MFPSQGADNAQIVALPEARAVALVFYGRREFVSILDLFLQVCHSPYTRSVLFVLNTIEKLKT